jgi:hypothetical protein
MNCRCFPPDNSSVRRKMPSRSRRMCICGDLRPACEFERRWESSGVVGKT